MQSYTSILLIVVMVVAFYFLIMRPQRKRQQQQQEMMKQLEPGSRVVTTTGIYATIVAVGEKQVVLETSPGSQVTMLKQAIGRVVQTEEEDAELASYRTGGAAPAAPAVVDSGAADSAADPADASGGEQADTASGSSASGLAGGAPIQEYAPGAGPDFTAPGENGTSDEHETAPWPAAGSEPSGQTPTGSELGSSDDQSSLNDYERRISEREQQENKDDSSGR